MWNKWVKTGVETGLIFVDGDKIDIRYSEQKLEALHGLMSQKQCKFITDVVRSMPSSHQINSAQDVNYLSRYSNNLISVSPLQSIDIEPTEQSKMRLFRNYVSA